ncbi:MAG: hypothetical protein K8J09_14440 [Planctomycetes bacterium]|nr:hypothetical protein [Planctomycetota bacterium]MCC7398536.1 hypothetical protein [Planctomycetota bacterium]
MKADNVALRQREAELAASAAAGVREWQQLALDWHSAGELAAARRCLDTGLVLADSCRDHCWLAMGWLHLDDEAGSNANRCLARARALASCHYDWFKIAERVQEQGLGSPRSDLERAEGCRGTAAQRRRLARAVRYWLGDDAWSARLGPRGISPAALTMPGRSRWGVERDAAALFDWLRARVTDADLACIAAADGGYDEAGHLEVLRDVRATGLVPSPMAWCPHEVASAANAGIDGVSSVASAFCGALIVLSCLGRLEPGDDRSWYEIDHQFPHLAANCTAVGPEALARLPGLLAAMLESPNELNACERAAAARALRQLGFVELAPDAP